MVCVPTQLLLVYIKLEGGDTFRYVALQWLNTTTSSTCTLHCIPPNTNSDKLCNLQQSVNAAETSCVNVTQSNLLEFLENNLLTDVAQRTPALVTCIWAGNIWACVNRHDSHVCTRLQLFSVSPITGRLAAVCVMTSNQTWTMMRWGCCSCRRLLRCDDTVSAEILWILHSIVVPVDVRKALVPSTSFFSFTLHGRLQLRLFWGE